MVGSVGGSGRQQEVAWEVARGSRRQQEIGGDSKR